MLGELNEAGPGRWRLRFTRQLPHPAERVWQAISKPEHLKAWFPQQITGDLLTPGAPLRFEQEGFGFGGEVLAVEPPALLEFSWGTDTIRLEITPAQDGCTLTLTDTIGEVGKAARDAAGWHVCLDALEAALAGTVPPVSARDGWQQVHPQYVAAFGPEAAAIGPPPAGQGG